MGCGGSTPTTEPSRGGGQVTYKAPYGQQQQQHHQQQQPFYGQQQHYQQDYHSQQMYGQQYNNYQQQPHQQQYYQQQQQHSGYQQQQHPHQLPPPYPGQGNNASPSTKSQTVTEGAVNAVYTGHEVLAHNAQSRWTHWFIYGDKIYDTERLASHYGALLQQKIGDKDHMYMYFRDRRNPPSVSSHDFWEVHPVGMLRLFYVPLKEIRLALPQFFLANLYRPNPKEYWQGIREDAAKMKRDFLKAKLTYYLKLYSMIVTRWLDLYENQDPSDEIKPGDPNSHQFLLPADITDPNDLRQLNELWGPFDFEVPQDGAWSTISEYFFTETGMEDDVFRSSLRVDDGTLSPMIMEIEGEAAWDTLATDVMKDEVTTSQQEEVWKSRENRRDLDDHDRMKRRISRLQTYFLKAYEYEPEKLKPFKDWFEKMKENDKQLQDLVERT